MKISEPTLLDREDAHAPVASQAAMTEAAIESPMLMFERMARDPQASVEKIERLMALWERSQARQAELLFNAAMSSAQSKMRRVGRDSENLQTHSRYASYEALDRVLRPIYTEYQFGLSFDTGDPPTPELVRVLCYVTHAAGHKRTYRVDIPADGKGAKGGDVMTKTHAFGSGLSYGMRYLLRMIFNVAVGEGDDDGNAAGQQRTDDETVSFPPPGYEEFVLSLEAAAGTGKPSFASAWNSSKPMHRNYMVKYDSRGWVALKTRAEHATKGPSNFTP